jgi:hypothetical protein
MAVGQRVYRIAYLLDVIAHRKQTDDVLITMMYRSMLCHLELLSRPDFFRAHTNHGLYQALGMIAAVRRFSWWPTIGAFLPTAENMLREILHRQFFDEGTHREHSPGYHFMILQSLLKARLSGLIGGELGETLLKAERALMWMTRPSCLLVPFGDTDPRRLDSVAVDPVLYKDPELLHIITRGAVGRVPESGVRAYPQAGYAFARIHEGQANSAAYLAFQAGFHSRVHKHADHLSFIWCDRHRDILIDPARYAYAGKTSVGSELHKEGFWYSDSKRIYCETTRAHNCLEVDGRNYQRNKIKPAGSMLRMANKQDGLVVIDSEATHFKFVRHRRHVIMAPGHFLIVLDWVYDRSGTVHDYRQWFHFDNSWRLVADGGLIRAHHPGTETVAPLDLTAASLLREPMLGPIVRGQEKPLLGWQSDKANSLIPSSCFDVHRRTGKPAIFATLFTLSPDLVVDDVTSRFNATMKVGRVAWTDSFGRHLLQIERGADDKLNVRRSTQRFDVCDAGRDGGARVLNPLGA